MKVAILYAAKTDGPRRKAFNFGGPRARGVLFIRAEIVECHTGDHLTEALDKAKPRQDETVLNAVDYTEL